ERRQPSGTIRDRECQRDRNREDLLTGMNTTRVLMPLAAAFVALATLVEVKPSAQGSEDLARRQYDSGLAFVQNGRYAEALKYFQAVVESFPKSGVADDALLQIAQYQLDVAHDQD